MELEALVARAARRRRRLWRIADGWLDLRAADGGACSTSGLRGREAAELFHGTLIAALDEWIARGGRGARPRRRSRSAAAA